MRFIDKQRLQWSFGKIFSIMLCSVSFAIHADNPHELYGAWPADNNNNNNLGVAGNESILNQSNVANLQMLWSTVDMNTGTPPVPSTPVLADGNVYYATSTGIIYSYTQSGVLNWSTQLYADAAKTIPEYFDESPVLTRDALFIGGNQMHRLDRNLGVEVWATLWDPVASQFVPAGDILPSQLMVAGNNVVYGVGFTDETEGGADNPLFPYTHGKVVAFNQENGQISWSLDMTQYNGVQYGTGVGSFAGGGVDEKLHLYFTGSGNNYAAPVSPISDSLLAINYQTGTLEWYYQYAQDDLFGDGGSNIQKDGNHDLDNPCHPQIFSILGLDLVGARGKDGTYRIFTRFQLDPNNVRPLAQIQLDPPTTSGGGIQLEPVINNGIMYIASVSWINPANPTVHSTLDSVSAFVAPFVATTTVRAINLERLIAYGLVQLFLGNTVPTCVGSIASGTNPTPIYPSNRCGGLLPPGIVLWERALNPIECLNSSGLTYANGVLFIPTLNGKVIMLNTDNGNTISTLSPFPITSGPFAGSALPVLGGVSIDNGQIFVPVGLVGTPTLPGGIAVYGLPAQ